jgi:hypothetical protein
MTSLTEQQKEQAARALESVLFWDIEGPRHRLAVCQDELARVGLQITAIPETTTFDEALGEFKKQLITAKEEK